MFRRFSSFILAGLLVLAAGHGSMSQLSAQSRACGFRVEELRPSGESKQSPAEQLIALLDDPSFEGTILIPSALTVDMGLTRNLAIRSCVTIKGARGGLDPGALIITRDPNDDELGPQHDGPVFAVIGKNVRIEGLRFRGPVTPDLRASLPDHGVSIKAIEVKDGATVTIDNNVFEYWSVAVIVIAPRRDSGLSCLEMAPLVTIKRNYFNRNADENSGYGVGMRGGCARIEGNLFNKNRHGVASSGPDERRGYVARYNYVLEGGFTVCPWWGCYWNQHFDAHGTGEGGYGGIAGDYIGITSNTIRGEQQGTGNQTRPAFMLRGAMTESASFQNNVVVHDNAGEAVRLKSGDACIVFDGGAPEPSAELCKLSVGRNRYNTDTTDRLAVGDFDADGIDDVFLANGSAWWYSSAGVTEWRFLRASTLGLKDLRLGNFIGDARTDVLYSGTSNWYVSSGGTAAPIRWRDDGTRLSDCVFGEFTGDDMTDALRADGSTWSVATNGSGPWTYQRESSIRAASLRVADFTNDGHDDVFWIASNTWRLWDPAQSALTIDSRKPVLDSDTPLLVVADFDGDGYADLAKSDAYGWIWLRTRAFSWNRLRWNDGRSKYDDIRKAVFGRFTVGDGSADAIQYATEDFSDPSKFGFALWTSTLNSFIPWSPDWVEMR